MTRAREIVAGLVLMATFGVAIIVGAQQRGQGGSPLSDGWRCTAQPTEPCFIHHGRLSSQNGLPFTIWLVGTKRIVNVSETEIPSFLDKYLEMTSENHSYVYGDFRLCPLEPDTPGHMREVCVSSAEKLVVQNLADSRRQFRLPSTWPRK